MTVSTQDLHQLLMAAFADQASEQLHTLSDGLLALQHAGEPWRAPLLEEVFREAHSLKGAARAADLYEVEDAAHRLESLLGAIQKGESSPDFAAANRTLEDVTVKVRQALAGTQVEPGPATLPLSSLLASLPHMVNALARALGKEVSLHTSGSRAEVDRRLLDGLRSPLTHLIRNCLDHGIEEPEARGAAGKTRAGHLIVHAERTRTALAIDVIDDGAGIDIQRVKAAAIERGMVTATRAEAMTARELSRLIFRSGLSTKPGVSRVSGRGVGMDAVRAEVERLGGTIEVESTLGAGSKFSLNVPLAAA
jgi:two-component system, chemotaxis family, sensor kinase CheA